MRHTVGLLDIRTSGQVDNPELLHINTSAFNSDVKSKFQFMLLTLSFGFEITILLIWRVPKMQAYGALTWLCW